MTITREQAYQELFGSDSAQTASAPQSGGFSREQAYQELFGNDGTVQPNSAGTNDTNSGLFNLPKNSTPFFPSANAVGDVTGIIVDAFGHTVNAVEQLASSFYRATDTGIALKRWFGDDSDKPNLYGKAIIDFSKNNLHSDEYNRQVEQGQANSVAIEQQLNQQKRAGTISEAEAFATDAVTSARNLFENPALLGQGLSTAIPSLATLALTKSPAAAATVGAGMGGAEVLENNQHFIDSVPQTLLSQSPVYQTLIQKGLSDGEARYYLANDLTEHGWHVAAAGGSEAVLDRLMFGKFLKPTGSVAKTTLQSGAMEGGQEVVQNTVSNDAVIRLAERLGIPTNKMRSDGAGNAFVLGAATGMAMGGGSALLNSGANPKTDSEQFNREIAESSQETSEQATRTEVDRTKLKEAFAPFAESLDENEYEALWQELVTDIEQGDLSEAMASEDREYAIIARAYAQAVGFEAQNASPTEGRVKVDNVDSVVGEIVRPQSAISGAEVQIELGSQGTKTAQYELVEADELEVNLKPNLYQNRDRTTVDSQAQIAEYASNLKPAYLGGSVDVTQGAPTVSQDYGVFAGNGRLAAIKQAYVKNPQNATAYRDYLAQNAPQFGFTAEQVQGMKQPVLVRKVAGNIDLKKAVEEGNFNTGLDKGVIGNAKANADYISDELLDLVEINEDGSLNLSESNTPFISSLVSRIPVEQRPQFFAEKKQGNQTAYTLTAQGRELVENALLVKAYSDGSSYADNLLTDLITGTEEGNKRVKAALTAIAGKVIQTKGTEYDISADLVQAYDLMSRGKKAGLNATEAANQGDLLNPPNETVQGLVGLFYSPKSISEVQQPLNAYLGKVIDSKLHQTEQGGLFEDENPTSEALLREAGLRFSRNNQPKNASENIARGRQAMEFAIENQTDVANAMYREGLGWVDFIWGSVGKIKPNNKTKGGQGISHIIEARMRKDHYSNDEAVNMLKNEIVNVIALGSEKQRSYNEKQKETRLTLEHAEHEVILVKPDESNGWIISGYKQKSADGQRVGFDTTEPTHSKPTLARQGMGAAENQTVNQSRGATTSDLHTTSPIRSRTDMGASDTNNVRPSTQDVNSSPEIQQAKTILEKALGKAYADQVNFVRSSDFNDGRATAEGFFQNGKVYIVADNIHSTNAMNKAERMVWVGWHEMAHNGIDVKLGGIYKNAMEQARKNVVVDRIAKAIEQEYQNQGITRNSKHYFTEEAIAELYSAFKTGNWAEIENRYGLKVPQTWTTGTSSGKLKSLLESVIRVVRNIASKITGKDLRKTSDSEIIGLLKQVDNAVHSLAENSENQTAYNAESRYSLNESADSAFAKAVDEVVDKLENLKQGKDVSGYSNETIKLGTTPDVFKMLGYPDVFVQMSRGVIEKAMRQYFNLPRGKHSNIHNLSPETLKQIPKQLNDPVAVYESDTKDGALVVLTELNAVERRTGENSPVIAALHFSEKNGKLDLINIASVYERNADKIARDDLSQRKVFYINKEKGRNLIRTYPSLQLASVVHDNSNLSARNVKTEADLSQYQAENSVRYSFAGRNAKTANHSLLEQAERDLASGKNAEEIRKETGWFKGVDGKWRFEIDDSQIILNGFDTEERLNRLPNINFKRFLYFQDSVEEIETPYFDHVDKIIKYKYKEIYKLGDLIIAPKLFEAYPELRDIRISGELMPIEIGGRYSSEKNEIVVNDLLNGSEIKSVLLHEIQHAIQKREDFARGGSPDLFKDYIENDTERAEKYYDELKELKLKQPPETLKLFSLYVNSEEEYERTKNPEKLREHIYAGIELKKLPDGEKLIGLHRTASMLYRGYTVTKEEQYKRLAGETEARNVQTRMNMTAEERLNRSPESTEDVQRENQIVRYADGSIANSLNENPNSDFAKAVDDVVNGRVRGKFVQMGTTPDVLKMLGLPDTNISINDEVIEKAMAKQLDSTVVAHKHPHNLTARDLKRLPTQLNNPIAVMKSSANSTNPNGFVILTEIVELKNGVEQPVIAALNVKQTTKGLEVVNISSVHGRPISQIKRFLTNDLLYWNKEKGYPFADSVGLHLPRRFSADNLSARNVKTEADLSQYQAENSGTPYSRQPQELSKSAIDNNGEFSAENEDIRYSRRPKSESLEKLRKAETIRITGNEIEPSEDLRQYKRNALEYGKKLREQSPFVNRDTGRKINLQRASLTEILQHDYKNPEHLQSVAAIPQIAENAIYIDTLPNEDTKRSDIKEFDYYLAGLNIGGKDYTVRMSVGESDLGDVYYDHKLTPIEKGRLLEARHSDNKSGVPQQQSAFDGVDDKRLLQILQDETSSESENTRYSRPPSVLEQLDSGEVYMPTEGILAAIKQGELKQAYLQSKDTLYESMVDETLPVDRWAEGMPIDPMTAKALISAKDRAEGIRMDLNTRVTEQFIRPVMKNLMALADKHNLDVLMAKHIAQYWYSARYSIEKNLELLQREEQAMKEAKKELADAKQKGDPDEIAKLARAERRATRKYKDRYHDVHLNNWQKGADGKYLISRKVGTAGGWSIPHARAIMAKAEQYIPAREIEAALKPLQDAVKWNIATNLAHGRISPAQAAEYRQKPHYVPLTGDPYTELHEMDNSSDFLSGAGSGGVNTARDHHLDGRQESEADGAIDAIMGMLDKTNANSGWSEFKFLIDDIYETALRDTLSNHPNLTLTQAKNEVYTRYGIRKQRLSGITRTSDKVIIRKFEGISYQYTLPDKVIDALIAGTTDSDGRAAWAFITTIPRNLTRWLARGVTLFIPTFALTNMISDLMDKGDLLMSEKITANGKQMTFFERAKLQMKLYANVPLSWKATTTFAFKGASALNNQRKMQRNLNRLLELGGISNYNTYLAQNRESLNKELQDMGKLHKKAFNATLTLVAGWNAIFDYTSSLAMFTTLTDAGVDEKQAATLVLNQMNFRKQGSFAKYGKPFYMFLNPSIQGTAKTVKSLKTRGGQAMFAFNLLVFFAIYAWAVSGADEDETGNDMMSNPFYPREIQLKLFGSELRIPIGFGQKQLAWGIVVNTIKAYEGQITYANAAANILSNTTKSLSPIAPSEVSPDKEPITWLINTFSPSIAKPFLQIGQNRNSFGTPIVNENRHNKLPVAYQGKPETAEFWKELAEQVYQNTEGKLNIHPEIYKHMFDSYRGILGSFGQYLSNQIENPALAERGKRERVLFLDRFYREVGDNKVQSMYYRAKEEMKPLLEQSELHKQQGTWNKWVTPEKRKRLKWYLDGESTLNKLYLEKSRLEKMRRLDRIRGTNQLSDERFSERVKLINSRIEKVQRQQIHEWRKMEGVRTTLPK